MQQTNIIDLGKVGITVEKTPWSASTFYERLTMVHHKESGNTYVSVEDNVNRDPSKDDGSNWILSSMNGMSIYELMVSRGKYSGTEEQFLAEYAKAVFDAKAAATTATKATTAALAAANEANEAKVQAAAATELCENATEKAKEATNEAKSAAENAASIKEALDNFIEQGGGATDAQVIKNTGDISQLTLKTCNITNDEITSYEEEISIINNNNEKIISFNDSGVSINSELRYNGSIMPKAADIEYAIEKTVSVDANNNILDESESIDIEDDNGNNIISIHNSSDEQESQGWYSDNNEELAYIDKDGFRSKSIRVLRGNDYVDIEDIVDDSSDYKISVKFSDFKSSTKTDSEVIDEILRFVSGKKSIITIDQDIHIDKAILIDSNTTIELNADIYQVDNVFDNCIRSSNVVFDNNDLSAYPSSIKSISNISIIGNGHTIYGCSTPKMGTNYLTGNVEQMIGDDWGVRTILLSMTNCHNVNISNLKFRRAHCYSMIFDLCTHCKIDNIDIVTPVGFYQYDGIDIRTGCKHFIIKDIHAEISDDAIALNAWYGRNVKYPYKNRYLYPIEAGHYYMASLYDKDESLLDIEDINIDSVEYKKLSSHGHGSIILTTNNRKISNVTYNNVKELDGSISVEAVIKLFYAARYSDIPSQDNCINNIRINNILSKYATSVLMSDVKCDNVWANKLVQESSGSISNLVYEDGIIITNS